MISALFRRHKRTIRVSHNKTAAREHSVMSPETRLFAVFAWFYVKTDITYKIEIYLSEVIL